MGLLLEVWVGLVLVLLCGRSYRGENEEAHGAVSEATVLTAATVDMPPCQVDADCALSNGQCYNQSSRWSSSVCGCGVDSTWDNQIYFRCTPNVSVVVVNRTLTPLYYLGQSRTWPTIWRCTLRYCTATVGVRAQLGLLYGLETLVNGTTLDPNLVQVRCLTGYRYTSAVNATLEDRCVACDTACGPHGTCASNVTKQCACATGWTGDECRSVVSVGSMSWYDHVYTDTETYNALRPCTLHSECGAYEKCFIRMAPAAQAGKGYCWCDEGRGPANTTSCGVVSQGVGSAPISVNVFWPTRFIWTILYDKSRQFWYRPWNSTETGGDFVGTAYNEMPALDAPTNVLPTTQHLHAFYCANESLYFWNTTADVYGLPSRHCQGCSGMCGPYANCSGSAGASNATSGTCVCLEGYTGTFCDRQAVANASCAAANCNAKGTCLLRRPWLTDPAPPPTGVTCECIDQWSGHNCTVYAPACALDQCDAQGQCVVDTNFCNCTTPWYGADCSLNSTQCRTARCSDHGTCTTDLQGCTCDAYYTDYQCGTKQCVGTNSTLNTTSGNCVCEFGRNGTHCENLICSGHGTYNATSLGCVCDTLWLQPRCATSQCGRNGTVIQVSTNNVSRTICDCATPYVADVSVNLTRCTLVCVRGTYSTATEVCTCPGTNQRYYGIRCELERSVPPDVRDEFDWAFQSLTVVLVMLLFTLSADLGYLMPAQMHQPHVQFRSQIREFDVNEQEQLFVRSRRNRLRTSLLSV